MSEESQSIIGESSVPPVESKEEPTVDELYEASEGAQRSARRLERFNTALATAHITINDLGDQIIGSILDINTAGDIGFFFLKSREFESQTVSMFWNTWRIERGGVQHEYTPRYIVPSQHQGIWGYRVGCKNKAGETLNLPANVDMVAARKNGRRRADVRHSLEEMDNEISVTLTKQEKKAIARLAGIVRDITSHHVRLDLTAACRVKRAVLDTITWEAFFGRGWKCLIYGTTYSCAILNLRNGGECVVKSPGLVRAILTLLKKSTFIPKDIDGEQVTNHAKIEPYETSNFRSIWNAMKRQNLEDNLINQIKKVRASCSYVKQLSLQDVVFISRFLAEGGKIEDFLASYRGNKLLQVHSQDPRDFEPAPPPTPETPILQNSFTELSVESAEQAANMKNQETEGQKSESAEEWAERQEAEANTCVNQLKGNNKPETVIPAQHPDSMDVTGTARVEDKAHLSVESTSQASTTVEPEVSLESKSEPSEKNHGLGALSKLLEGVKSAIRAKKTFDGSQLGSAKHQAKNGQTEEGRTGTNYLSAKQFEGSGGLVDGKAPTGAGHHHGGHYWTDYLGSGPSEHHDYTGKTSRRDDAGRPIGLRHDEADPQETKSTRNVGPTHDSKKDGDLPDLGYEDGPPRRREGSVSSSKTTRREESNEEGASESFDSGGVEYRGNRPPRVKRRSSHDVGLSENAEAAKKAARVRKLEKIGIDSLSDELLMELRGILEEMYYYEIRNKGETKDNQN